MKTTKEIWYDVQTEIDKLSFDGNISNDKWFSEEEMKEAVYKACLGVDFRCDNPEKELQDYFYKELLGDKK
jgi:hypothetical protein